MKQFEVGHSYWALDPGLSKITVLKRTAQFIKVRNDYGTEWRMKIREYECKNGSRFEIAFDCAVGSKWREAFTYSTMFED